MQMPALSQDTIALIVVAATFLTVAMLVAMVGLAVSRRVRIRERLAVGAAAGGLNVSDPLGLAGGSSARSPVTEKWLGLDPQKTSKLRLELIRAGFFAPEAVTYFILIRAACVLVLPVVSYLALPIFMPGLDPKVVLGLSMVFLVLGYLGPDAYVKRTTEANVQEYRNLFPDFLDLILVCVDAGLSLESALERVSGEMVHRNRNFATNLALMGAEMRAGRSTSDALDSLAERLSLDEAQSFSMLLRQSLELGTDVSDALTTFSEEMRDKRLSRAEAKAYALPVKLVVPLGAFIFPVLMIAILAPALLKMAKALQSF
ncbi:type II secretion system F family protein [Alsobacter sp. SYSU M60028]|uniref:Type II secretion system F family protein n=1 Tax=Alsobacter ponti TaxID=2962936 RepID=A0ABT1L8P9_9HYPH|nr:type II secretion system F family protein [Alsobacter ponti]MCP8937862.1 type II secretion system F family protein [Alsobacter ponti]